MFAEGHSPNRYSATYRVKEILMLVLAVFLGFVLVVLLRRRWLTEKQEKEIYDLRHALGNTLAQYVGVKMKTGVGYDHRSIYATRSVVNGKIVNHKNYRHAEIRWADNKLDYSFSFGDEYEGGSIAPIEIAKLLGAIEKLVPPAHARKVS